MEFEEHLDINADAWESLVNHEAGHALDFYHHSNESESWMSYSSDRRSHTNQKELGLFFRGAK